MCNKFCRSVKVISCKMAVLNFKVLVFGFTAMAFVSTCYRVAMRNFRKRNVYRSKVITTIKPFYTVA